MKINAIWLPAFIVTFNPCKVIIDFFLLTLAFFIFFEPTFTILSNKFNAEKLFSISELASAFSKSLLKSSVAFEMSFVVVFIALLKYLGRTIINKDNASEIINNVIFTLSNAIVEITTKDIL